MLSLFWFYCYFHFICYTGEYNLYWSWFQVVLPTGYRTFRTILKGWWAIKRINRYKNIVLRVYQWKVRRRWDLATNLWSLRFNPTNRGPVLFLITHRLPPWKITRRIIWGLSLNTQSHKKSFSYVCKKKVFLFILSRVVNNALFVQCIIICITRYFFNESWNSDPSPITFLWSNGIRIHQSWAVHGYFFGISSTGILSTCISSTSSSFLF